MLKIFSHLKDFKERSDERPPPPPGVWHGPSGPRGLCGPWRARSAAPGQVARSPAWLPRGALKERTWAAERTWPTAPGVLAHRGLTFAASWAGRGDWWRDNGLLPHDAERLGRKQSPGPGHSHGLIAAPTLSSRGCPPPPKLRAADKNQNEREGGRCHLQGISHHSRAGRCCG